MAICPICTCTPNPIHADENMTTGKGRKNDGRKRKGSRKGNEVVKSDSLTELNRCGKRIQRLFKREDKRAYIINSSGFEFDLPVVVAGELDASEVFSMRGFRLVEPISKIM